MSLTPLTTDEHRHVMIECQPCGGKAIKTPLKSSCDDNVEAAGSVTMLLQNHRR